MRPLVRTLCTALAVLASTAPAHAQEQEPNSFCAAAQRAGEIATPGTFQGSVDAVDVGSDVDFLVFSAPPFAALTVELESGGDVFLGSFDARCRLMTTSLRRLGVDVPASGRFVVGVAVQDDRDFNGRGTRGVGGPYTLRFGRQGPGIGSISARAIDARSRGPLGDSDVYPFAVFVLERCEGDACTQVSARALEPDGRTRIERDRSRVRITPGTFRLLVLANDYELATSERFNVAEGQHVDVGDVAAEPPAIGITDVRVCANLPPQGGTCRYSARIRNDTAQPFSGLARSLAFAGGFTSFEASTQPGDPGVRRVRVTLAPGENTEVAFSVSLPVSVPEGTVLCPFLELGLDPAPLFNSARSAPLFCIQKNGPVFRTLTGEEAQAALEQN